MTTPITPPLPPGFVLEAAKNDIPPPPPGFEVIGAHASSIREGPAIDPAEGLSRYERTMIGVGRGASGVYQGVKQIGLQLGERAGLVEPGAAAAYTREKEDEHALYDKYSEGLGTAGKVGKFVGGAVAVPIPGVGAGSSLLGRLATGAAMGAGQGALEFVPKGGSRLTNAAFGGLFGAGAQGLVAEPLRYAGGKLVGLLRGGNSQLTDRAQQALDFAAQHKLPIYYDDLAQSGTARMLGTFADDLPVVGTSGTRNRQAQAAQRAAQDFADRFATTSTGRVGDTLRDSAERQLSRAKAVKNELYSRAFEPLNAVGEFDLPKTQEMAKKMIEAEVKKGSLANGGLIGELQRYVDSPKFNFEGWHGVRSDLGGTIRQKMSGENAVLSDSATARLKLLKSAMDNELSSAASSAGAGAKNAWQRADKFYRETMPQYKRGVVADLLKSKNPDAIADRILNGSDNEGIAREIFGALDKSGRADVRATLLTQALDRAKVVQPDGGEVFSPALFARELNRVNKRSEVFFRAEDKAQLDGLKNYMEFVKRAGQHAANPPTGKRALPHLAILVGTGAMGAKAIGAYAGAAASARLLLRTQAGRDLLLRMGRVSPQSKAAEEIISQMGAYLARGAASEAASSLELDIVGGQVGEVPSEAEMERLRMR